MKASVLTAKNNISYEEVELPELKQGEVTLKVKACGICSSDFNRVYKDSAYFFPIILGHEFAGIIDKCADDIDQTLVGKKAAVFPLLPCKECEFCKNKQYAQCTNYNYFGSRCNGAMAQYINVPLWNIKLLPDDMPLSLAAMCEPTAVAMHSIGKLEEIENKNICISGNGTIGIICGLYAKSKGANVAFVMRNNKKQAFLEELGFSNFIYDTKNSEKFDIVLEGVGSNESVNNCIGIVKSHGTIILIGNPASDIELPQKTYWKLLRSEIKVQGVWNSSYKNSESDDWDKAIEFLYQNQETLSKLITDRFPLSAGIKAYETIKQSDKFSLKGVFEL